MHPLVNTIGNIVASRYLKYPQTHGEIKKTAVDQKNLSWVAVGGSPIPGRDKPLNPANFEIFRNFDFSDQEFPILANHPPR